MLNYVFGSIIIIINIIRIIDALKAMYLMCCKDKYTEAFLKYIW